MAHRTIEEMKSAYEATKNAVVGSQIKCPACGKSLTKKTKDHSFCSNGRTKGAGNCKDGYWNKVDPEKRCRKTPYYKNVICKPSDESDWPLGVDEGPEGWDGHKD